MTSAIDLIRRDHEAIRQGFESFSGATGAEDQYRLVHELLVELETHSAIEEELFYPWTRSQGLGDSVVDIAEEEHHAARNLMLEIARLEPGNPRLSAKLMVLKEAVETHVAREEEQMLDFASHFDAEGLEQIGRQMEERRPQARQEAEQMLTSDILQTFRDLSQQLAEARRRAAA